MTEGKVCLELFSQSSLILILPCSMTFFNNDNVFLITVKAGLQFKGQKQRVGRPSAVMKNKF